MRPFGRFEFRAKLPHGLGFWPALWMLATNYPTPPHWPSCGEIDVVENRGSIPNEVLGTLHYETAGGSYNSTTTTFTFPSGDGATNFHTYILQWATNSFRWSIDSNAPYKTRSTWTSSTGPYPAPFNKPFYIIMNLAVGGSFLGDPSDTDINANTTFPGEVQIDYVRIYDDTPSQPAILSVTPSNGCTAGGTVITVTGSNFVNGATITIGGASATSVTFVNTNTLTAITPGNSAGAKDVVVNISGSPSTTLTNGFTYYDMPVFAGLGSVTPAVEGATLSWSGASGVAPFTYEIWKGPSVEALDYVLTTNTLSAFIPLYPGSNSLLSYFFWVVSIDVCRNYDANSVYLSVQPLLDPNNDQDSDGMSNGFEQQYGLNPFDSADAAMDADGDGLSNLQEYLAGTDPTDRASPFHIISVAQEGSDVRITWVDAGGRTNVVEATSELNGSYSNISPNIIITGTGVNVTNYLDVGVITNTPLQFYRIRLVP